MNLRAKSLIHLIRIYIEDIGMSFGLEKCGRMIARGGKVIKTDGLELPVGHIADIQTSYNYLGIPQSHGNHDEEARTATSKYHQRVKQVLKSQINGKSKIQAITYAQHIRPNSHQIPCRHSELDK